MYRVVPSFWQKCSFVIMTAFSFLLITLWLAGKVALTPFILVLLLCFIAFYSYPIAFTYTADFTDKALHIQEGPLFHTVIPLSEVTDFKQEGVYFSRKAGLTNQVSIKYRKGKHYAAYSMNLKEVDLFIEDFKKRLTAVQHRLPSGK